MEYDFTLKYQLAADDRDPAAIVERLGAAGCDDALVGTGVAQRIALAFTREAETADAALRSALADVRRALPGARLTEAGPDYVGLTDVADLLAMSRQNLRKLMLNHPDSFPPPVHEGSASIWRLADLLAWFAERGHALQPALLEAAGAARQVNLARDAGQLSPEMLQGIKPLIS
ncbi:helix-turn-helix transcriptional regulator [Noviherbaspirillum suwonense]|jgi:predicted DNA-binding transcriptional regulator AlpA|uniref:Transcriptional regulator, AlpA family n=1 Tax=Noviherbaspirillum suwonense TaxID=1224511 RepID=A0ABY1PUB1_9BURK|nr:DNA-binding protein [Noviherbaspirillum suwonense]SMP45461.1 transcriptional regulator, AlpA family [Noviherbaspirillum suwonense]